MILSPIRTPEKAEKLAPRVRKGPGSGMNAEPPDDLYPVSFELGAQGRVLDAQDATRGPLASVDVLEDVDNYAFFHEAEKLFQRVSPLPDEHLLREKASELEFELAGGCRGIDVTIISCHGSSLLSPCAAKFGPARFQG